jgi:probable addiction module antidote protein
MALETFPYDTADYLTKPDDIFYFLEAELEENEPHYWPGAVATVARARGGFEQLAAETALPMDELRRAADESCTPDRDALVKLMEAYRKRMSSTSQVA